MSNFKTPGVYIQEISTLPASIAAVETAIPAFIGYTEYAGGVGDNSLLNTPTRITSMLEYIQLFGGPKGEAFTVEIEEVYSGSTAHVFESRTVRVKLDKSALSAYKLFYSLQMFFANGGGPCYIVSVGDYDATVVAGTQSPPAGILGGLKSLEKADEPTLLVFPDYLNVAGYKDIYDQALAHCNKLQDRFTIMDLKVETGNTVTDAAAFRDDGIGINNLKYGAVYYPNLKTSLTYGFNEGTGPGAVVITHTATNPDLAITAAETKFNGKALSNPGVNDGVKEVDPSLYRSILVEINKFFVDLAPGGAMAGIYAQVDSQRGVWKAPANVSLNSVIAPAFKVTAEQQADLNVDATSGKSINVIRNFTGKGTLVWGARTLAGNDNEWRYIPVRRLYIFVEESVKKATEFVVFEPNDANTWLRVKTMIENFLSGLWRDGALAGASTSDAFFVNVGLGQTMTAQDILEGRMNIEIGLAAVRPAEFIILKFSHKLQES